MEGDSTAQLINCFFYNIKSKAIAARVKAGSVVHVKNSFVMFRMDARTIVFYNQLNGIATRFTGNMNEGFADIAEMNRIFNKVFQNNAHKGRVGLKRCAFETGLYLDAPLVNHS